MSTKQESAENALWLIVLSDMMTNLMLFFIVMFAVSSQGTTALKAMQEGFAKSKDEAPPKPVADGEDPILKMFAKSKNAVVTADFVKLTLPGPVLFGSGRAELSEGAVAVLSEIGQNLAALPGEVEVEGHTDNVRIGARSAFRTNDELSAARAAAVVRHFVESWKLDPKRFTVAGYGEFRPAAENATPEGRAQNRRIEIVIQRR